MFDSSVSIELGLKALVSDIDAKLSALHRLGSGCSLHAIKSLVLRTSSAAGLRAGSGVQGGGAGVRGGGGGRGRGVHGARQKAV